MKTSNWKCFGKIAASIALSVIIGFFWISNTQKITKITKNPHNFNLGSVFTKYLTDKTLVVFWASWCISCKEDLKELKKFRASNLPKGFSILAVNIDRVENLSQAKLLWSELEIKDIKLLFDKNANYQNLLSIDLLPSYFVFEKNGKILLRLDGKINFSDKKILSLLFS